MKLPRGLQVRDGKYIVDKVVNGERIKKRLSATTEEQAVREYSALVCDTERGKRESSAACSLTVDSVLTYYYEHHLKYIVSRILENDLIPAITGKTGKLFSSTDYYKMIRKWVTLYFFCEHSANTFLK